MRLSKRFVFLLGMGALFIFVNQYRKRRSSGQLVKISKFRVQHLLMNKEKSPDKEVDIYDELDMELMEKIRSLMEENKLYRDEYFSLEILAEKLGIHRNIVSRIINQSTGKHFKRFINEYRVREAIQIISTSQELFTLDEIMHNVGFHSRTPFFKTFKDLTGLTPRAFIKERHT